MQNETIAIAVRRHADGAPILAPTHRVWENGVTFNAAVTYLPQTAANDALIRGLLSAADKPNANVTSGLVIVHYRARPRTDPGYLITRSYVGLALFTADYELIHRFADPVVSPDTDKTALDYLGVEDPRVTQIGDKYYMVYCGSGLDSAGAWRGTLCAAESSDLIHWTKLGAVDLKFPASDSAKKFDDSYFDNLAGATGALGHVNNKDGVLFPGPIDGWYYFLHRPMLGKISTWAIHLARAKSLDGAWADLGPIATAKPHADYVDAWLGAGAVPIDLGDGRFLEIYHSGHRAADGSRLYTLGAIVMDFNRLDPARPAGCVESRVDHFMFPETSWEIEGPYPDSVGNVIFSCGAYERDDDIHILYGGGDTFVMAAAVSKNDLLTALTTV